MQWLNHPLSAKDQTRLHQFGKIVLPGIFFGKALFAVRNLERRYFVLQTLEELGNWNASEILARRLRTAKLSGRDHELREPTLRREQPTGSEGGRVSTDRNKR